MNKKTVVVGMSGGVDSSVAALLLKEQGYNVIGLFMHNWEEEENGQCTSAADWNDVQAVCGKLGIRHYSVNFSSQYMDRVFKYFLEEYKKGRTPNPDVLCNREIKFAPFTEYAFKLGADYVATGHYANLESAGNENYLLKAVDEGKDQTYFLNQVSTRQFDKILFPLGKIQKKQVREIAVANGLATAKKKDSTGICFIGERKFRDFLATYLPNCKGKICDMHDNIVGEHLGLMYYTMGQRKGLGIGGVSGEDNNRWYVVKKDLNANILFVSNGEGEELFSKGLICSGLNWIGVKMPNEFECTAKFRYRQSEQPVKVKIENESALVDFFTRQRAITEGQYVVFYKDNICLGGGVIEKSF